GCHAGGRHANLRERKLWLPRDRKCEEREASYTSTSTETSLADGFAARSCITRRVPSMASRMLASAVSLESPSETQPGRAGQRATYPPPSLSRRRTTLNFIGGVHSPARDIGFPGLAEAPHESRHDRAVTSSWRPRRPCGW